MAITGNLLVRVGADIRGLQSNLRQAQGNIRQFSSNANTSMGNLRNIMRSASRGMALDIGAMTESLSMGRAGFVALAVSATAAFAIIAKKGVDSAIEYEASMMQVNRIMGQSSSEFMNWANTQAIAYNMSRGEAVKYGAVYGNLLMGISGSQSQTMQMTTDLLKASAVVASATGRTMVDTMDRIRSGLLGNTEAIEDLGINVNVAMLESTQAFQKFANGKSWQQLSFQTQQQIRYFAILEQASTKFGAEVANNASSALTQFNALLKDSMLNIGQAFMPILNIVTPILISFAQNLKYVTGIFSEFMNVLFGTDKKQKQTSTSAVQMAKAQTALGNATKKAGDKAKQGVAGFDEINQLQEQMKDTASGATDGVSSGAPTTGAGSSGEDATGGLLSSDAIAKIQAFRDGFINAWASIKDYVSNNKEVIISAIAGIGTALVAVGAILAGPAIVSAFETLYLVGLYACDAIVGAIAAISLPITLVVASIAGLVAMFTYLYQTNEPFRTFVQDIWQGICDFFKDLWNNVLVPLGNFIGNAFTTAWEALTKSAKWLYDNVLVPIGSFLLDFWHNVIEPLASCLSDVLAIAFDYVKSNANALWNDVLVPLGDFFSSLFQPAVEAISAVFGVLWNDVLVPFGTFLKTVFTPVFQGIGTAISWVWKEILKPLVTFIAGEFKTAFSSTCKSIGEVIGGLKTVFIGILNFIRDVFKGDWGKAWEDIKTVFKGVVDTFEAIFKAPLNLIIDLVNGFIDKINEIKIPPIVVMGKTVFDGVPSIGVKHIPKLARGGIVSSPTLAQVGEAGTEAIVPLENTSFVDTLASALGNAVLSAMQFNNQSSSGAGGNVTIQIDSTQLARVMIPAMNKEQGRIGNMAILQSV